ncbi:MAG: GAK system XXXCH domain-containing protein [Desulfobacterales bacterium]|jgi:XXXCH domain-containing protein
MKGREQKLKRELAPGQVADFFRSIADAIEGNVPVDGEDAAGLFDDFYKASLKLKRKGPTIALEAKVESPPPAVPEPIDDPGQGQQAPGKPKYKSLKKRMKSTFGSIRDSLAQNRMPAADIVASFLEDSRLMVGYEGYGDDYYGEYADACQRFADAFESTDWNGFKAAYETLRQLKNDCHKRYK